MRQLIFCIFLLYASLCTADGPIIAAASNLTIPLTEIAKQYESGSGTSVRLTFGSSGNLARQIVQGAPYKMFISASYDYVDFLASQGTIVNAGIELVHGQLVVYIPNQSALQGISNLRVVITHLQYRNYRKIALANPEHAPYGVAAMQALQNAGLWAIESNRTLLAESVSQVMQFALSGNVDVAVIPYSFMQQNNFRDQGSYFLVPDHWHEPVSQYVVLLSNADQATHDFMAYLYTDAAREVFVKYGYSYSD